MTEWKTFEGPDFLCEGPGDPQIESVPQEENKAGRDVYTFRKENGFLYEVRVNHVPEGHDAQMLKGDLAVKIKNGAQAHFRNDEGFFDASPETGDGGLQMHYVTYEEIEHTQGGWSMIFTRGQDLYHAIALFPRTGDNDAEGFRFVNSFQLRPE
jgi:hypothetical protein